MNDPNLPGRTDWETHQYLTDQGHRVAAAQAYRYLAKRIETDDTYPLPEGSEVVIARAAAAMQSLAAIREAVAEARAAIREQAERGMNPYEAARERLEAACQERREAKRDRDEAEAYLLRAEAEWAGATRNLRQYETTPGIPLPEWRNEVGR